MIRNTFWIIRSWICAMAILLTNNCGTPSPGCPHCAEDLQLSSILPGDTPFNSLEMKWCALNGVPSVEDPSLVCEDNVEEVLLNRHLRAGTCNWTQCKILVGTIFGPTANYGLFDDPNLSIGAPGDLVVNNTSLTQEMEELANPCDNHWNMQPNGITAIAIREFINTDGTDSPINGIAFANSGTRPFLFIGDLEFFPSTGGALHSNTERVLAHELGHVLGLCHANGDEGVACNSGFLDFNTFDNLMSGAGSSVNSRTLEVEQCDIARTRYPHLFFPHDRTYTSIASILDEGGENYAPADKSIDLYKTLVFNHLPEKGHLEVLIGTNGLFNERKTDYWVLLDVDNKVSTGLNSHQIVSGSNQEGVDMVVKVEVSNNGNGSNNTLYKAGANEFEPHSLPPQLLKTVLETSEMYVSSPEECSSIPVFQEIGIKLSREALMRYSLFREVDFSFSNGLKVQTIAAGTAADGTEVVDKCPELPRIIFGQKP
ncbi:zinc metalloprotease [Cyclobacterium plantarum]|uniref:Peptidase M43 pregnancy-associated plasma-A domain-containing protein n=1 Tax=Cyclobacterium plantarum TaxID=2716263 RepID=A0ABX0H941_9BACT|nr:hypothetical protein [Cyclobacterium plantarum]NHE56495.1 hypothetical protein [Cyclobacterium plantarum]